MKVGIEQWIGWDKAKQMMLRTIGKRPIKGKEMPTKEQKLEWLIGEHSHIKVVTWCITLDQLRQWVGVHLLRHEHLLPYITTQRGDRTDEADKVLAIIREDIVNDPDFDRTKWRDWRTQGSENNHAFVANAQTLINISRRRLCSTASQETRMAWGIVKDAIEDQDKEMAAVMVPNCIYRGFCPEKHCCGYVNSSAYATRLKQYRALIGR